MIRIETNSPKETTDFAELLGQNLRPGDVLALDGELGTGKTVFSKGIAKALQIKEPVTSPTFIIMQEYRDGIIPLYHFDVYRIEDPEELYEIGAEEYFGGDGICLVEWASVISDILPEKRIHVTLQKANESGFDHRILTIEGLSGEDEEFINNNWRSYENSGN